MEDRALSSLNIGTLSPPTARTFQRKSPIDKETLCDNWILMLFGNSQHGVKWNALPKKKSSILPRMPDF